MKADSVPLEKLINSPIQYLVPLFQRQYSWDKEEWEELWENLEKLYNDLIVLDENKKPRPHFMGSIVTMPMPSKPGDISQYLLIDGQQRLTTIFILLAVLRDLAKSFNSKLSDQILNTFLVNPYEDQETPNYYKLQPTQLDRSAFFQIINSSEFTSTSRIAKCYRFFEKVIQKKAPDHQNLKNVICSSLSVVSILLEENDDPYLVFESLNATGKPLNQSDLVRNHFFMQIAATDQQSVYDKYWQPMEDNISDDLTEFIRQYLTKNTPEIKKDEVYSQMKDKIEKSDPLSCLSDLYSFSEYYSRLLDPSREPSETARKYLLRINRLGFATVHPFLLNCYHEWVKEKSISENDFVLILQVLENFLLRRFVCGTSSRRLNRIFASLYSNVRKEMDFSSKNFVECMKLVLQSEDYPKDSEFQSKLCSAKLYGEKRTEKVKLILESIEEYFEHKEQVSFKNLTIEHVMPQSTNTNQSWQKYLGENWAEAYNLLHTLGNLTLTAYNSELSDKAFEEKKKELADSKLELNKYFQSKAAWRREDIEERSKHLAKIALDIWSDFGDELYKPSQLD